ncbi:MAG: formyl transferase [Balneolaceae bacterium]
MNIVIISEYATRELYVIEQIIKQYPSAVVVQPTYSEKASNQTLQKKTFFKDLANRVSWKLHRELWNRKIYPGKNFPEISNKVLIPSDDLNGEKGIETVKKLSPDVLITCRSPLLKPGLIEIPSLAAINIHYGIAPFYRGNDTLFWPLFYNDFDHLGGCIHHLTKGIDTGNIIAEVYPELHFRDGEISVDCKTTHLLAQAVLRFLQAVEKSGESFSGKPQKETGRNFNSKERTLSKSLKYLAKRALGFSHPPKRSAKVVTYFNESIPLPKQRK